MNPSQRSIDKDFAMASNLARQGHYGHAELLCTDILKAAPRHFDALLLRGVIELQTNRLDAAARTIGTAIQMQPRHSVAHMLLGDALLDLHEPAAASRSYRRCTELSPGLAAAHVGLGNALLDLQAPRDAAESFARALALEPEQPEAYFGLGNAHFALHRYGEGLENFNRAIALQPDHARAHCNRGATLLAMHRSVEALASIDAALARDPHLAGAWRNRARILQEQRRWREAVAALEQLLRLEPRDAMAHFNLGLASLEGNQANAAVLASFERALALQPDIVPALRLCGDVLLNLQRPAEAAQRYSQLLHLAPGMDYGVGALWHAQQCAALWTPLVGGIDRAHVEERVRAGERIDSPFSFMSVSDSAEAQQQCARTFAADRLRIEPISWTAGPYGHERIRIAYISPDFRSHAVSYLMAGVFECHDRAKFESFAIALRPEEDSAFGRRIRGAFSQFVGVDDRDTAEIVAMLRGMEIDIAVDLAGYTDGMRPEVFAQRAAPVQVNYLGFSGTLGARHMDYILADEFVIPQKLQHRYDESVVYLPGCFQPNDDQRAMASRPTRGEAGLPDSAVVLCCFNNTYKINSRMFDIWMRLLRQLPDALLWLRSAAPEAQANLRQSAALRGVDPRRLTFAPRLPYDEHLARFGLADLFLDTLPFNACTTASDALWAGVPVLTCAGEAFAARAAGSLLHAIGLSELVTYDLEQYEASALALLRDPERLADIRRRLQEARRAAPLFDTRRFCRGLEQAYEQMWRRHEQGLPPAPFAVPRLQ